MNNDTALGDDAAKKRGFIASYAVSLALFALAAALVYFSYVVSRVAEQIPDILASINNTSDKIEPVVTEVGRIIELVPPILDEVEATRNAIPPILREVELTRAQIPPILEEVELTRAQLPAILNQIEAVRKDLPEVLESADRASAAVVAISKEVEATRPLIPEILQQVETTRESVPPMMDRADQLIEKARVAGKEASQGAVSGLFSGIIMAPFALMADVGRGVTGMSKEEAKAYDEKDFDLIENTVITLLNTGAEGDEREWRNPESGNRGTVKLLSIYAGGEYGEFECRTIDLKLYIKDKLSKETSRSLCKNDEGKWDFHQ